MCKCYNDKVASSRMCKRESGENPERYRHCERGAAFITTGRPGRESSVEPSQENCLIVRFRNTVILTAGFGKAHIFLGFKFPEDHGGFYKGSFSLMLDKIALRAKLLHGTSDSDPADMVKIGKLRLRRDFFSGLISTVFDLLGDDIHKLLVKRLDRIFI